MVNPEVHILEQIRDTHSPYTWESPNPALVLPKLHCKSRDITSPTTVRLVQAMVFPVVMYGCELDHKED